MGSFDGLLERAKKNYSDSFTRTITENGSGSTQAAVSAPQRTVTASSFEGLFERAKANYTDSFRSEEQRSTVVDWMDRFNRVMKGVSDYDKKRNGGYTQDASGGFGTEIESLIADFDGIKDYAADYGLMNSKNYLDQLKQLQNSIQGINDNFSQFEDEDAYNRYMEYWKDQEKKRNLDLDAYSREIAQLEQQLEDYDPQIDWTNPTERKQYDAGLKELEDEINRRKQYLAQAQRIQKKDDFSAVANPESEKYDADFDSKSGYVSTEQDGKLQRIMSQYSMGYNDLTYEYINNQNGIRDEIKHKASAYSKGETPFEEKGYDYMTEDEVSLYNYYYSMGGKASAEAYLGTIQEDLNQRKAAGMYQQMEGKTGAEMVFGVEAGLDQFKGGIKSAARAVKGDDSYVAPSATQYASGMVREDLADDGFKLPAWLGGASLGQVGYDTITTTANMAPSIAVGMLNPTLGTAALGVSAGGSAYQEALNEGYSVDQARGYGILSGASEIVMERLLGGISVYGGNALGKFFTQNMKNADTALKRIAREIGGSMLSEFSEEYLQEVLTPVFQNLTLGTDNKVKLVSAEALYAGFLGAITGGIMEGPQAIMKGRNATQAINNSTPELSKATETAEKSTPLPGNATVDKVSETTGESPAVGEQQTATAVDPATGKEILQVRQGAAGTVTDPEMVAPETRRTASDNTNAASDNTNAGFVTQKGQSDTITGKEDSGKAVQISTGRSVEIIRIAGTDKNGGMTFALSDGSTVEADDIQYSSEGEAVLYEAVAALGTDAEVSNILVNNWKQDPADVSAEEYTAGMLEAFNYGRYHIPQTEMAGNESIQALTDVQRNSAYALGRAFGSELVQTREANIRRGQAAAKAGTAAQAARKAAAAVTSPSSGKVHFDRQGRTLNAVQETGLKTMEQLSQLFGTEFHVFESYEKDGRRVFRDETGVERDAPNGWYDPETGHIHIDLNAGSGGRGTMLFTVAHELTHFIRDWSPAKFDKLAEAVIELVYKEKGIRVVNLVREQQAKAARNGMELSFDEAYEEVVADSMESILTSGNVVELMAEVKQQDQSLWQKIRKWFRDLAGDIRKLINAYAGYKPDSAEGRAVAAMEEMLPVLESFYMDALQEASGNYQATEGQKNTTPEGGNVKYSISYRDAIEQLSEGTLDRKTNTHLLVSENTPKVYIDKAGAKDQKIIIGWDIAYLAMKKSGDIPGNYHGLGKEVMKNLPEALKDPLYIVKQNNGRVAAVTEIVVKKNRSVVVSVEFDAFKSTIQDGETASDNYNIIVTAMDAKPNYLQNTILSGNVVHNKNNENPANFILRLKSLNKALPNDDLARSSKPSIRNGESEVKNKYSFAGRNAVSADHSALQQAEKLAEQGADNEAIRQRTGWFKGMDGKWRFEIDDSQMEISEEISNYMRLGDLMQHEKLYAAYPDLADIDVVFQSLDAGVNGSYHPQFDSINLSYRLKNDPIGLKDALVHELQHAIQQREGFTKGATAESWERKKKAGFDSRRAEDIRKAQDTERELRRIQEEEPEFYRDMVELDAMTPDLPRGEINWDTLEKISDDPIEWQQYDARREELEAKYGDTKVWDMNDLLYQREQAARNVGRSGVELYFDTAGEIEARDASNRRSKSPEQRKSSPPRLGNEDTVFAEGAGPSADYVGKTADGIEVYETSENTKNLTWAERKKTFLHLMRQQYRGRTAKFIRNGHAYYAKFEYRDVSKNIYGDDKSDPKGRDAKINVGADGNIFELVENSKYSRSETERGKTQRMHRGVNHWDYFVKTVQIDGTVFDLTANVRKKADGEFVYIIEMVENKEIEPSSPQDSLNSGRSGVPNSSIISISNSEPEVNRKFSQRDPLQEKAVKALEKENAQLKEDVSRLRDLVKLQKKLTGGKMVKPSSVESAARVLKKTADAAGDTKELAKLLGEFYTYIVNGEELTWEGVQEAAQGAADWLWNNRRQTTDEYSAEILKDLRTRGISFNEDQKSEAAVTHDTFANYRKALFGSVKITENGMPLDDAWQELSAHYPGVFPEDTNSGDMPRALADIVSKLKNSKGGVPSYDETMMRQAMIREVYDSYWNVSTLYTVADVKQKEINALKSRHAQRISDLRTKHREKVEQLRQEQRSAVEAVRAAERQRYQERTRKALDKHRDNQKQVAANRAERREKTEVRKKIRKTVMELDKLLNRGDKKKNVKDGMSAMVSSSLKLADALFMDEYSNRDMLRNGVGIQMTDTEEKLFQEAQQLMAAIESGAVIEGMEFDGEIDAMEQMKKLDGKLSGKMAKLKDVFARERKRLYGTTVSELLGQLADEYSRLSEAEDGAIRAAKDENVYAHLLQLQKDVGGTTVRDMNINQLEQVADAYTMVLTTVRNANKMFAKNLKFKRDTLAGMVMGEIGAAAKKISKLVSPGKDAADKFSWNNLKPVYAFERLGSQTLKTLFGNIRKGQDVWAVDMQEADAFRRDQYKKHKRKDWDMEKQYSFEFESGKVDLSLEQIMSLYAYSRREAALDHLLKGGFVFGGSTEVFVKKNGIKRRYLKKDATAYNLSAIELMQVIDSLTKEQKAFVEEMQTYLSDVMGGKGNEVSMQMYGIKSFGEKNYFPLRSAGQYMEKAKEDSFRKEQGQISIVNSGFTKATTPHASNPITLDGFMDVWAEHVNDMAMYHGFVLPMEDFRRVYNYSTPNVEEGNSQSVNAAIENAFGKAATGYIDQLYKDLNGGAVGDNREGIGKKLVGLHKKAAVFASASVVIQQPSAIVRAFALVDPRHFIGPKVNRQRHKQLWAELKQYAPVAFVKEMGYFDTGMGRSARDYLQAEEYSGIREKMAALFTDADYRDEILGKAPALADEYTWCAIWEAVKRETKAKNPGIHVKGADFLRLCGDRFAEVIDKTQVYDSVLSRSANMRSKSLHMNMLTSFMAEPTTSINMLEDALRNGDRKEIKRTVGAVYGSVLLNSLLVSLVYAARDDDEEETYWEKYLSSVAVEVLDGINPITYYPFLRDIWSIGQGYDVERADMSLITDFANAAKTVVSGIKAVQDAEDDGRKEALGLLKDSLWTMTDSIASLTGLPVKNIRRDIEGARNMYQTISKDLAGRKTTNLSLQDAVLADMMNAIPIGNLLYSRNKRDQLYGALVAGDAAYVQRLRAGYESDTAYHSAIKLALRENDSRIWEAAVAWNSGDMETYIRIAKEIQGENRFDQDDIVLAIRAEASAMIETERSSASTVKGYFTNEKFGVAMGQNNVSMADTIRQDLIDTAVANGKTREEAEESVRSTARTQLKQLYTNGTITGTNAEKMLVKYGGYDQKDAANKVAEWKYAKDFPELDGRISYTQYKRWEADGKSRGVSLEIFTDVAEYQDSGTSGSNRSQADVADYINRLPISTTQKDALWCCFWKESTLYKNAPWH